MFIHRFLLFAVIASIGAGSKCDLGHKTCISKVSPSSYCKRDSNSCHGAPHVSCSCKKRESDAPSKPDSNKDKAVKSVKQSKLQKQTPKKQTKRKEYSNNPHSQSSSHEPRRSSDAAVSRPRKMLRKDTRSSVTVTESNDGIFLWLEWPSMRSSEWTSFYDNVLNFMKSNCGQFKVSRVIARVLSPDFQSSRGRLWQVGTDSVFYQSFLAKVPQGTEIMIYPYMLESNPAVWMADMGTSTGLEGVYKYVSEWNALLSKERPYIRIAGIVTDYEEHKGFESHLPNISFYKEVYSTPGQPVLRFGTAMGYDQPRRAASISSNIDDVYLEMYDFYEHGSKPTILFEQGKVKNDIETTLAKMDDAVWQRFLRLYDQGNLHFMWSLQARSSKECLYPIAGKKCGTKDDLGVWDAPKAAEFINTVKARYPQMRNKLHGFFEFSYMPTSWMQC
jgi:hypothetical protein